jgi:ABC-type polysaccharide/polyol phosphate transport system ATPase subunit
MVAITLKNVSLTYKVRHKFSFARSVVGVPEASSVQVRFKDGVHALTDVSFDLVSGDRLGLVGANGSGKTTLLKVLHGVFEPTAGEVRISGRRDALFNINLGFRASATGRRNIELRGLINGWSSSDINERMPGIIEFSELGDFIDMPLESYSLGMAARLAFSIATSFEPEILLMDEWIGAGDPAFQEKARARMSVMTDKAGIIVLASHSYPLLKRTCNKVLELNQGKLVYFGEAVPWFESGANS